MEMHHVTPYSTLTDEEFVRHLLSKGEPTAEDVEASLRMEMLLSNYSALLEEIHTAALSGLNEHDGARALERIRELTAPARN
jgi:hypothetical protein